MIITVRARLLHSLHQRALNLSSHIVKYPRRYRYSNHVVNIACTGYPFAISQWSTDDWRSTVLCALCRSSFESNRGIPHVNKRERSIKLQEAPRSPEEDQQARDGMHRSHCIPQLASGWRSDCQKLQVHISWRPAESWLHLDACSAASSTPTLGQTHRTRDAFRLEPAAAHYVWYFSTAVLYFRKLYAEGGFPCFVAYNILCQGRSVPTLLMDSILGGWRATARLIPG